MIALPAAILPLLDRVSEVAARRRIPAALVGGSVRDAILGRPLHDLDFAAQGDAIGLGRAVANALEAAFYVMDAERGTARVLVNEPGGSFILDFARCRGITWEDDLRARDLTLNAIAILLPADGTPLPPEVPLFDPLDGAGDLARRVIRQASPTAITDDPIRALRVARFATMLDARIDPDTEAAARATAARLAGGGGPSAERGRDELFKTLGLSRAADAADLLDTLGLLEILIPEAVFARPFAALRAIDNLLAEAETRRPGLGARLAEPLANGPRLALLRLVALCAAAGPAALDRRGRALRLSVAEIERAKATGAGSSLSERLREPRAEYAWMRAARGAAPEAALLGMALAPAPALAELGWGLIDRFEARYAPDVAAPPLLSGDDILALGIPPGPAVGAALEAAREAQMIGEISTREEALAVARSLLGQG